VFITTKQTLQYKFRNFLLKNDGNVHGRISFIFFNSDLLGLSLEAFVIARVNNKRESVQFCHGVLKNEGLKSTGFYRIVDTVCIHSLSKGYSKSVFLKC